MQKKVNELEQQLENTKVSSENDVFGSLSQKEKDALKIKIQDLISKLEYHISS